MSNNLSPISPFAVSTTTEMKVFTKRVKQENGSGSKGIQIGDEQEPFASLRTESLIAKLVASREVEKCRKESSSLREKIRRLEEDCKKLRERQEEHQQVIKALFVATERKEREFKEKVAELQVAKRKAEDLSGVWKKLFRDLQRKVSRIAEENVEMEEQSLGKRMNPNLPKNVINVDEDSIQKVDNCRENGSKGDSVLSSGRKKKRNVRVVVDTNDEEERCCGDGDDLGLRSRLRKKKKIFYGNDDSSFNHSSREVSEEQISSSPIITKKKVKSHRRHCEKEKNLTRKRKASPGQILCAEWREEVLRANWKSCHPTCIKSISQSYISASSYFQLPKDFCKENLPSRDTAMVLEDEKGLEFKFHYNAVRTRIRGWRRFSLNHNLKLGDVLIFELREPTKFKVCIVRADRDDLSAHFVGEDTDLMSLPKGKH